MTVDDLREILSDPDLPGSAPVKVRTSHGVSTWEWKLEGAHATTTGPDQHLTLELWTDMAGGE